MTISISAKTAQLRSIQFAKALIILVGISMIVETAVAAKSTFPRLGGIYNGKTPYTGYEDPEYHKSLARLDVVILGFPVGWSHNGTTPRDVAKSIKKRNPSVLLGQYTILGEVHKTTNAGEAFRNKIGSEKGPNNGNASDWWARDKNGKKTSVWPNTWYVNLTEYVKPDSNGRRWPQFLAKALYDEWFFAPEWDIWYADAAFGKPRPTSEGGSVDWSGGKVKNTDELHAAYRRGHLAYFNAIKKLRPDMIVMPNLGGWVKQNTGSGRLSEYDQKVSAGQFEGLMGRSFSNEAEPGGWHKAMNEFRSAMSYLKNPKILLFNVSGNPKDYQFFRYAFASSLMDNGYFSFRTNDQYAHGFLPWFDEYDAAGTRGTSWLGKSLSGPSKSPWKNGVYRRDFENGVALINPKGNGKQTITIEPGFVRIKGKQATKVNNGQPAGSITLNDRDGIILIRAGGQTVSANADPRAPTLEVQ